MLPAQLESCHDKLDLPSCSLPGHRAGCWHRDLPCCYSKPRALNAGRHPRAWQVARRGPLRRPAKRSEEHTSELQSLMRISYAVFCLKKKTKINKHKNTQEKRTYLSTNV